MLGCLAMEFKVWGQGLRVEGFGFRDSVAGFGVQCIGFMDSGFWISVDQSVFMVKG